MNLMHLLLQLNEIFSRSSTVAGLLGHPTAIDFVIKCHNISENVRTFQKRFQKSVKVHLFFRCKLIFVRIDSLWRQNTQNHALTTTTTPPPPHRFYFPPVASIPDLSHTGAHTCAVTFLWYPPRNLFFVPEYSYRYSYSYSYS